MDDLKPCPFCGGKAYESVRMDEDLATHDIVEWKQVECLDCGISFDIPDGYEGGSSKDMWNKRCK